MSFTSDLATVPSDLNIINASYNPEKLMWIPWNSSTVQDAVRPFVAKWKKDVENVEEEFDYDLRGDVVVAFPDTQDEYNYMDKGDVEISILNGEINFLLWMENWLGTSVVFRTYEVKLNLKTREYTLAKCGESRHWS